MKINVIDIYCIMFYEDLVKIWGRYLILLNIVFCSNKKLWINKKLLRF